MGQIEDLRLFVTVVDSGGIARAAEALGIAKSAVSRRLGRLEGRYDVRLIDRQPGNWAVTNAGQELYQRAGAMVSEADDLDADFMHSSHSPSGPLTVSIAREFGLSFLQPVLFDFMKARPEIDLTLDFDDRTVDLDGENYDLAIRITRSDLAGLTHYPLGVTRHGLFASPSYAEKHGLPKDLGELGTHPLLNYGATRRARWEFLSQGKVKAVEFQPALNSNSGTFLLDAALNGLGIIRLPDFIVARAVRDETLIQVLPELEHADFGIYVVYGANRRLNKRMRVFVETLERRFATLCR
ncbi:MAG: LysR family transcriptional regulator [Pseudomonadota bacterium]